MTANAATTIERAKDLLSLVPFAWGILTISLLGPAWRWSSEDEKYHVGRSLAAVVMSILSLAIGAIVVIALLPIGIEAAFKNNGDIEGILVMYELFLLAVIGATVSAAYVLVAALRHLRDVTRG